MVSSHPRDRSVSQGQSCMSSLPPRERSGSPSTPIAKRLAANEASVTTPCRSTATCFAHHHQTNTAGKILALCFGVVYLLVHVPVAVVLTGEAKANKV